MAGALRDEPHDVPHDAGDVEVLWRVDRRDPCGTQLRDVLLGNDPADDDRCLDAFGSQPLDDVGDQRAVRPERIDRPTTCTPSCSAEAAIWAGVSRIPS